LIAQNPKFGRKVRKMKGTPIYYVPGKKTSNNQFYRNYWCSDYELCLNTAAREDLYLDCTQCFLKDTIVEEFSIFITKKR